MVIDAPLPSTRPTDTPFSFLTNVVSFLVWNWKDTEVLELVAVTQERSIADKRIPEQVKVVLRRRAFLSNITWIPGPGVTVYESAHAPK